MCCAVPENGMCSLVQSGPPLNQLPRLATTKAPALAPCGLDQRLGGLNQRFVSPRLSTPKSLLPPSGLNGTVDPAPPHRGRDEQADRTNA